MAEMLNKTTQNGTTANPLDQAWEQINALGGAVVDDYSRAFNEATGKALDVIEKLGGMNPDVRNASPAVQKAYKHFREESAKVDAMRTETNRMNLITDIIREVSELPDRTSPNDQPEMMLVSAKELRAIIEGRLGAR